MRPVTKISILGVRLAVLALIGYWILIFAGTHTPSFAQVSPDVNDKVKHFAAFFGLATLLCYVTTSDRYVRRFGGIAAVAMTYAAIDEWTQSFVPNRVADPSDFLADTAGIWSAILFYVSVKWLAGKWKRRGESTSQADRE